MAKRKHKSLDSGKESVEDQVLKRYHKFKKFRAKFDAEEEVNANEVADEQQTEAQTDPNVSESDAIEAEKIFKKVKKIKDKNLKKLKKLKKSAKTESKEETIDQISDTKSDNKSVSALKYLNDWKYRRNDWKFNKNFQNWLLKNWRDIKKISEEDFVLFLEYILPLKSESSARKRLESETKQVIDGQTEAEEVIERARSISQCFV